MANKKDFSTEFSELLGVKAQEPLEQQPIAAEQETCGGTSTRRKYGSKPSINAEAKEQRCTFVLDAELLQRLRIAAFNETGRQGVRISIKEVLTSALQDYLKRKGY